jgi:hypothetical protein
MDCGVLPFSSRPVVLHNLPVFQVLEIVVLVLVEHAELKSYEKTASFKRLSQKIEIGLQCESDIA